MNNDYMFEDEIDEEAGAELERQRKTQQEANQQTQNYNSSTDNQTNGQGFNQNQYHYQQYYHQPNYNNNYGGYGGYGPRNGKRFGTSKANASMILGILSLVFFCSCINAVTAIISIILGIIYLRTYDLSQGKARAIAGIVTSVVSLVLLYGSYAYMTSNDNLLNLMDDEFIQFYYNSEDGANIISPYDFTDEGNFLEELERETDNIL